MEKIELKEGKREENEKNSRVGGERESQKGSK